MFSKKFSAFLEIRPRLTHLHTFNTKYFTIINVTVLSNDSSLIQTVLILGCLRVIKCYVSIWPNSYVPQLKIIYDSIFVFVSS